MVATMLGDVRPCIHRFRLGSFEITTILDGSVVRDAIQPPFCMDQDSAAIEALASANNLPSTTFEHTFTTTIVNTGSQLVLIDTGNGAARADSGVGHLTRHLPEAGYQP